MPASSDPQLPLPLRSRPWLALPVAAALFLPLDPGAADVAAPVDAGSVSGSLELGGTADTQAVPAGAGSLDLGGSGVPSGQGAGAGSLTLGGTSAPAASASGSGSLVLGGSGTAIVSVSSPGSLTLGGSGTARAVPAGAGSLAFGGTAQPTVTAATAGSIVLSGAGAARAPSDGTGSLTLGGTAAAWAVAVSTGAVTLGGASSAAAMLSGAGSLTLGGSGSVTFTATGAGSITLGGTGTARARPTGAGSITLGGTAAGVKLGVLKVNVGTALSPDWRDIGCGGHPASGIDFLDDFNRADSGTLPSPWTVYNGTWGVVSNTGKPLTNATGANTFTTALVDAGSASVDVQVKVRRTSSGGWSEIVFGYDPTADNGYRLRFDFGGQTRLVRASKTDTPGTDHNVSVISPALGSAGSTFYTFRVVYDQPTATARVYLDGVLKATITDGAGGLTGTWVGIGTTNGSGGNPVVETFDDFTITPAVAATVGRLKLWDGTQWVQEKCDNAALFSDNFNRADSTTTLGSPWTVVSEGGGGAGVGKFGISSNRAYCSASYTDGFGTTHGTLAYVDYGISDFDMSVKWSATDPDYGVMFRLSGTASFFWIGANRLWYYSAGATILNNFTSAFAANDIMRVVAVGSTINIYKNGALLRQQIDARNVTATRHGFMGNAGAPAFLDDFSLSPIARPLYVWTGTAWDKVACLVPA